MALKTDYKDFIPSTGVRYARIKDEAGAIINSKVELEDVTTYTQEGDTFGAADMNATNIKVNENITAIDNLETKVSENTETLDELVPQVDENTETLIKLAMAGNIPIATKTLLPIRMDAGLMDFSITGADNLKWYFPDGTTSTSTQPAKTLTEPGVVYAVCDDWSKGTIEVIDNNTDPKYVGNTSDLEYLTYLANFGNCTNLTGDISSLSNLAYYANFYGCSNLTGDILNLSNLTNYANFYGCSNLMGVLNPKPTLNHIDLRVTGLSISDVDQSIINLNDVTTVTDGTLRLTGLQRSSASTGAINSLVAKGWTVSDATVV